MTEQKRILVKEKLAPEGVRFLEEQGFAVDIGTEWDAEELVARIKDYHGLIIRSATKVTAEVIQAADKLQVVGRAGVGVDNVDVKEATRRGIIVVNAPQSNVLTAAEHTVALMMACARNIPQAHADLKAGKWEKGKWGKGGVELQDKVLGIIGLGRIGFLVAERARGLKMKVLAYDPYVPAEKFHELGLDRADSPNQVYREADFITVHLPKNAETIGFVDDDAFAQMKDGVRVINVARGGIIDEEAWARAVESGKVAASAVDVYPKEPTTESPLFQYDSVVCTPHLGASTVEAQLRAGTIIAEQVALALKGQFAPNAVNIPLVPGDEVDELMPYLALCEMLGKLIVQVADGPVAAVDITYEGVIGRYDTRILTLGVLQGMLAGKVEGEVNFVNVAGIAEERGISAREIKQPAAVDFLNVITVSARKAGEQLDVAGTTLGPRHRPRFVGIYGHDIDIGPVPNMVFLRAEAQVPGILGTIGGKLGEFGINISQVTVAPTEPGEPGVMGLAISQPMSDDQLAQIIASAGLLDAKRVKL
jgi:D-3-phosphoglycerate dehydrogenase